MTAQWAFGSAFAVNEMSARAQGMGGAFTSIGDDASTLFFNPAGAGFLRGTHVQMESLVVVGEFRFFPSNTPPGVVVPEKGYSGATHQPFIPVASMYLTHRLTEKIGIGFAVYTPFGLAANWTNFNDGDPANTKYVGRFAGTRAQLQSYWFQPTVAYRLSKSQAISLGVAFVHTHILLEQSFLNPNDKPDDFGRRLAKDVFPGVDPNAAFASFSRLLPEGRLRAAAVANSPAFSLGYMFKHEKSGWGFGAMMRSAVANHLTGDASFAFTNTGALTPFLPKNRTLNIEFPNQRITGLFTTPATYVAGVSKAHLKGGTLALDLRVQDFHRFKDFPINFSQTTDGNGNDIGTPPERRLKFNFHNSYLVQTGYERPITAAFGPKMMQPLMKDLTVRAGFVFDYSPVPDESVGPLFPDASRASFTVGMTKRRGNKEFTLFYQHMHFMDRTTNVADNAYQFTNGDYRSMAHLAGMGLHWTLGKDVTK